MGLELIIVSCFLKQQHEADSTISKSVVPQNKQTAKKHKKMHRTAFSNVFHVSDSADPVLCGEIHLPGA